MCPNGFPVGFPISSPQNQARSKQEHTPAAVHGGKLLLAAFKCTTHLQSRCTYFRFALCNPTWSLKRDPRTAAPIEIGHLHRTPYIPVFTYHAHLKNLPENPQKVKFNTALGGTTWKPWPPKLNEPQAASKGGTALQAVRGKPDCSLGSGCPCPPAHRCTAVPHSSRPPRCARSAPARR